MTISSRGVRFFRSNAVCSFKSRLMAACSVWNAQQDYRAKYVGPQDCGIVSNHRTQVVAGDHCLFVAEGMYQPNHIANKLKMRVILHVRRSVGLTVTAHIWGHCVVTGTGQGGQDVPPAIPEFRPTVRLIPFTWMNRCLMLVTWAEIADIAANVTDTPRESKKGIPASWQPPASYGTTEARRGGKKRRSQTKTRRLRGRD